MKKKLFVAVLVMMSAASVFASGNKEDETQYYGRGPAMGGWNNDGGGYGRGGMMWRDEDGNPITTAEEITVEGSLVLEEGTMPYLNTDEGKVFLMVPPFVWDDIDLKGGETVTVTGYDMPEDRWGNETESTFLHVVSAVVDGKTLTVDQDMMGYGGRGGRGGMPGRGGRGGW